MKILQYLSFLGSVIYMTSCTGDQPEPIFYDDGDFIAFEGNSSNMGENVALEDGTLVGDTVTLSILRASSDVSAPVDVTFSVTSEYSDGSDASGTFGVIPGNGQVTIPAGAGATEVKVYSVDNFEPDGAKTVTLSIENASVDITIGLPGPDSYNAMHEVTIADDDCPLELASAYLNIVDGDAEGAREVTITYDEANDVYAISDIHGYVTSGGNPLAIPSNFVIDDFNNITIPPQTAFGVLNWSGSGKVRPCDNIFDYTLTEGFFGLTTQHEVVSNN